MVLHTGTVAWFNNAMRFGFLHEEGQPQVFCHYTAIQMNGFKTLIQGEMVQFEVVEGPRGPQASMVKRVA